MQNTNNNNSSGSWETTNPEALKEQMFASGQDKLWPGLAGSNEEVAGEEVV